MAGACSMVGNESYVYKFWQEILKEICQLEGVAEKIRVISDRFLENKMGRFHVAQDRDYSNEPVGFYKMLGIFSV
jgi:hypothetical protein